MTKPLGDDEKRLRRLTPGALADEAGALKASLARIKDEAIRRDVRRSEGELFRLTMTPPGKQSRLDRKALDRTYGASVIAALCYEVDTEWRMTVSARKSSS